MNERQKEQRELALERSDWICPVCGLPLDTYGSKQYAHRIAQTKENYSKYGSFVIDNTLNGEYVCSLACNSALNIGHNKGKILELLVDIVLYEIRKGGFANG